MASRSSARRGLLIVALVLVALAIVVDLLRSDSLILGTLQRMNPPQTEAERFIRNIQKQRAFPRRPLR